MTYAKPNNPIGWFHYYVAYLIANCGADSFNKAIDLTLLHSIETFDDDQEGGHLSENQCVMKTNNWLYIPTDVENKIFMPNQNITFKVSHSLYEYWQDRLVDVTMLSLYAVRDHDTIWPVGGDSLILAESEDMVIKLLDFQLLKHGLKPYDEHPYTIRKIDIIGPSVIIFHSGEY